VAQVVEHLSSNHDLLFKPQNIKNKKLLILISFKRNKKKSQCDNNKSILDYIQIYANIIIKCNSKNLCKEEMSKQAKVPQAPDMTALRITGKCGRHARTGKSFCNLSGKD
jgi:hypothetical protein